MSVNVFRVCAIGAFSIVTALPQDAATAVYKKQLDDLHAQ